jgi:hypothetical protein
MVNALAYTVCIELVLVYLQRLYRKRPDTEVTLEGAPSNDFHGISCVGSFYGNVDNERRSTIYATENRV